MKEHMNRTGEKVKQALPLCARLCRALVLFPVLYLLLSTPAFASFEQVATFAESGEAKQLKRAGGVAVNRMGAGGVPAGTIYVKRSNRIVRYGPQGEFREAWGYGVSSVAYPPKFERCGPDGDPAHPVCNTIRPGDVEATPGAIAVDQATGNVYIRQSNGGWGFEHYLKVYNADGSQLIAVFGETAASGETVDQSPEKFHSGSGAPFPGLAVDDLGRLYVPDYGGGESRIMVFEPQSPGDYEHYVYAGRASDITVPASGFVAFLPVLDDAGNLYVASAESIDEFDLDAPDAPSCEYEVGDDGLSALTVNPANGEVFYWDYKKNPKVIEQLSACNGQGEFEEKGTSTLTPKPKTASEMVQLAFNPDLTWEASRPSGVLYAVNANTGGDDGEERGYIFAPAEIHPPEIESEQVSSVTATTALLGAQVDPRGSLTHYVFQYLTAAEYEANPPGERFAGASEAPVGGATLPSNEEVSAAAASLVGLQPDTEYRFRVIASSHCEPEHEENLCEDTGEDEAFRTFPEEAPGMPDNRAWELVSPAQKNGGEVFPLEPDVGSGARCDGASGGCKPGATKSQSRFPKQSSPDGEAVVYEGFPFSSTEGAAIFNEYISHRDEKTGWQTTILAPAAMSGYYEAFDEELSRGILYQETPTLTPESSGEYPNLYTQPTATPSSLMPLISAEPPNRSPRIEYAGASDDLSHVFFEANDALTGETPFAPEAVDGGAAEYNLYEWFGGQLRLVNVLPGNLETVTGNGDPFGFAHASANGISFDGSHAYWSDKAGQVYVRIDGESTLAIPDPGKFLAASEDGSKVLLSNGHLYDLETEATTDLAAGQGGFQGIVGQTEDLSHIYFVDTAVLTGEEENDHGAKAQPGKPNLYAWDEGAATFVATLLPTDGTGNGRPADWFTSFPIRTAEASPGGRWLAFLSEASLTGYDNAGCGGKGIAPCPEAFLYDSQSGSLLCASCNPSGARPLGPTRLPVSHGGLQPRYLTDAGRLYFDTQDALSPFDTNRGAEGLDVFGNPSGAGNTGAEDVYEYEPQGVGTCGREGGCVSLLSAGHESGDSNFLAIDETGKDVFFTTRDQLVQKDRDDLIDLYVAREGGGILSETETARGECQGEACQPQVSPPNDPTPGSSAFEGAGNVVEEAKAKKHRKHHKHRHKAKRHRHKRAAKHNRGGGR
jgi:hypothetical protein